MLEVCFAIARSVTTSCAAISALDCHPPYVDHELLGVEHPVLEWTAHPAAPVDEPLARVQLFDVLRRADQVSTTASHSPPAGTASPPGAVRSPRTAEGPGGCPAE